MLTRIFFTSFFLLSCHLCFAQAFNYLVDGSAYPTAANGVIIPQKANQSILAWRREPRGGRIVSADIVPSVTFNQGVYAPDSVSVFGWAYHEGVSGESGFDIFYTVCDASTLFIRNGSLSSFTLDYIQSELEKKNLGTVEQRQAYIASFSLNNVQLIDLSTVFEPLVNMLGPWVLTGLSIALGLFCLDLAFSTNKKVIGKAERAARRQILNDIKNDKEAKGMRSDLALLYGMANGGFNVDRATRRRARKEFKEVARRYEEYKRANGWIL